MQKTAQSYIFICIFNKLFKLFEDFVDTLYIAKSIQSTIFHPSKRSVLILSSHQRLGFPLFLSFRYPS
jgi:hypothetical protein